LNFIPRPARNLRQAASTDSRVLVETGLSGISSLCVFWRIRVASVELIDRCHREGPCYSFYNGYLMQSFNGLAGSALRDQSFNSDELSVKENRLPCFLEWLTPSKWPQITQTGRSAEKASSPAVEAAKLRFRHSHKLKQSRSLENRSSWWPASFPLEMAFFCGTRR